MSELFSALDSLAADDLHAMAEPTLLARTESLLSARSRLDAEIARSLQVMDARDVTVHECGRTVRSWLVEEQRLAREDATRRMLVARATPFHPELTAAMATGELSHEHARLILGCLRRLPGEWAVVAESELIEASRRVDPTSLGQLCRELRVRSCADEDAEALAQRMYDERWLTMSTTFEGMVHLEGMLDPESGATVAAALGPMLVRAGADDTRLAAQRRADALVELARRALAAGALPDHGGDRPQVVVTIPWTELRDGIAAGQPSRASLNGVPITPSIARRIACDAGILPAVLGADGEILDLGRSQRLFSKAQRRAAALRDGGCVFPDCQAHLERCQLHHLDFWEHGGRSDLHNSAYLCAFHHWLVHNSRWAITRDGQGRIEVQRT
jgi:hypothetical protein